ncbi:MAG: pilus assembly protein PilM, partial [Candidatus Omnitrophica bacterium]|nr:pilus assembly protein PilM [Candidatus Omnitrophota bacterium]
MAKKEQIGLYLGVNSVAASLVEARKLVSSACADISSDQDSVEKLQENVRIQASLNKIMREAHIDSKEINLSAADKNFIFRYLELPLMRKKDIESALFFEIEKYIPFKTKELIWDYQYVRSRRDKKTKVSFVGMRENNYKEIKEILSQLDLSLKSLEPASISLARLVKSNKDFSKDKDFVILDVSSHEGYLTFFHDELPVFNRHFDISKTEGEFDKDKFVEAVNYSFQYFRREYKKANIGKIIAVGSVLDKQVISSLEETLRLEVKKVLPSELVSFQKELSSEEIKSSGVALRKTLSYKFNPILEEREEPLAAETAKVVDITTGWRYQILTGLLIIGLLGSYFFWSFLNQRVEAKKESIITEEKNIEVADSLAGLSKQAVEEKVAEKKEQIEYLKESESFN